MMAPTIGDRHIQPGIVEFASRDHRAKRTCGVEGCASKCTTHENVEGQSHSDRKRRKVAGSPRNSSTKYNRYEEEREHCLDDEAGNRRDCNRRAAKSEVVCECRCAEVGDDAAEQGSQQERASDASCELALL